MNLMVLLLVMLGGALGSGTRYLLGTLLNRVDQPIPWGTFLVNIVGALLFGFIVTITAEGKYLSREQTIGMVAGFLGGLTTFSSFAGESFNLLRGRDFANFGAYMAGSLILGLVGVWIGTRLASAIQ